MKDALLSNIKKTDTGCWEWQGYCDKDGYGQFPRLVEGAGRKVHVLSYLVFRGEVPEGKLVCHTCDNPPCCNPSHLFLGTHTDNRQDASKKGRIPKGDKHPLKLNPLLASRGEQHSKIMQVVAAKGETHPKARLTEEKVREIRNSHAPGQRNVEELARKFQVSKSLVEKILSRKVWKHI